jgi:hypothetical protein
MSETMNDSNMKARAVFCDLDFEAINKLKKSPIASKLDHDMMINHRDGSGGITPRGNYTVGKDISE